MNVEQLIREAFSAMNMRDFEKAFSVFADDLVVTNFVPQQVGLEAFKVLNIAQLAAFPDWCFDLKEIQTQGEKATVLLQASGTHTGVFNLPGMPAISASGKKVSVPGKLICTVGADFKIHRMDFDPPPGGGFEGILQQLGVQMPG